MNFDRKCGLALMSLVWLVAVGALATVSVLGWAFFRAGQALLTIIGG